MIQLTKANKCGRRGEEVRGQGMMASGMGLQSGMLCSLRALPVTRQDSVVVVGSCYKTRV